MGFDSFYGIDARSPENVSAWPEVITWQIMHTTCLVDDLKGWKTSTGHDPDIAYYATLSKRVNSSTATGSQMLFTNTPSSESTS